MADRNSIYCPSCRQKTALTDRAKYGHEDYLSGHYISECNSCNFFFLVERNYSGNIRNISPKTLPKPIKERTPDFLKKDLEEAYLCFSVNAYRATGVMARRALQLCCIEKGAPANKILIEQIQWLLEQQVITKDLNDWAHEVRLTGNDSAHPSKDINKDNPISQDNAEDILNLLEQFIETLYITPALAKERQEKRKNAKVSE